MFGVDICCIDKSSSAELSKAINSMCTNTTTGRLSVIHIFLDVDSDEL